jgi:hypothetical protein
MSRLGCWKRIAMRGPSRRGPQGAPGGALVLAVALLFAMGCGGQDSWSVELDGEASTPVLSPRGSILVVTSAPALYSLNEDGTTQWRVALEGSAEGTESTDGPLGPVVFQDGDIVVPVGSSALARFSADGHKRWQVVLPSPLTAELAALADGSVAAPGAEGTLAVVRADGVPTMEYRDVPAGALSWTAAPMVTAEGALVGVLGGRMVVRVEKDGTRKWLHQTQSTTQALALGPEGSTVYLSRSGSADLASGRGLIVLGHDGQERWRALLPEGAFYEPAVEFSGAVHVVSTGYAQGPLLARYERGVPRQAVELPALAVSGPLLAAGGERVVRLEKDQLQVYSAQGMLLQQVSLPSWRTTPLLVEGGALFATAGSTVHRVQLDVEGMARAPWARPRADSRSSGALRFMP